MKKVLKSMLCMFLCVCMIMPTLAFFSSAASVGKVSGVTVSQNKTTSVTLNWNSVSGAKGYRVYQYDAEQGKWVFVKTTSKTTYTVKDLTSAKTYKFRVRAYKGSDKKTFGAYSDVVITATLPGQVKGLNASSITTTELVLGWNKVKRAAGYRIYVFDANSAKWKKVGTTTATSSKIKGLNAGQTYKFKVNAYYNDGTKDYEGAYSDILTTAAKPNKVTGLTVIATTSKSVSLKWNKVNGATDYQVYKYVDGKWTKAATTKNNSCTISATKTELEYKVRARITLADSTVYGAYSDTVKAAASAEDVAPNAPKTPTDLKLTADTTNKCINISWKGVSGATGYQVETYDYGNGQWKTIADTTGTSYNYPVSVTSDYYFRVRSYVKSGSKTYYSDYTPVADIEYTAPGNANDTSLSDLERYGILGYMYDAKEGCFYNTVDAIHRVAGFSPVYDVFAPVAICFYNTVRIDFTYDSLDWRIQLWKGQYGWCFIGGEAGVYTRPAGVNVADFYSCASNENMLQMSMVVYHNGRKLFTRPYGYYWWCTGYVFGINPGALGSIVGNADTSSLKMILRITLRNDDMRAEFCKGLDEAGFIQGATYLNSDSYKKAYIYVGNEVFLKWI